MLRPEYKKSNDDILVQLNDWTTFDKTIVDDDGSSSDESPSNKYKKKWKKKKRHFTIRAFGITEEGHSISIDFTGFKPFFFLEVPEGWNRNVVRIFKKLLQSRVNHYSVDSLIDFVGVQKIPYYGFCNYEKKYYIKLVFDNISGYYSYLKVLRETEENPIRVQNENYNFNKLLLETKIAPLLRFFHIKQIKPVGWIKMSRGKFQHNIPKNTRCQIDCTMNFDDVIPVDMEKIGKFVVASYDIECTSCDGTFPNATRQEDEIIQIGTTINIFGDEKIYKYIATLKKSNPIEGVTVEEFKTERDLLIGWCRFMKRLDPDIITGYNIWGFDWKYIYERALTGNGGLVPPYQEQVLRILSRVNIDDKGKYKAKYVEKELQSSALGQNFLYFISIEGVVQVDLYKQIMKDYNLTSYKLDAVAEKFMGQNKEDLKPSKIFSNYRRGTKEDIKQIATYCVQDCALCNNLLNKLQVIPNNVGMGNVCYIPFSYLFLRGQGIKIYSLAIKFCSEEGFLIKNLSEEDIDKKSYEGAIVFVPEPGIYYDPVAVMDYASLYPSSMISENISHDTLIGFKEYYLKDKKNKKDLDEYELRKDTYNEKYNNLPDYNYTDIEYDLFVGVDKDKRKVGYKVCRYAEKKNGEKGVLPRILQDLLKARRDTRKKIKYKTGITKDGKEYIGLLEEKDDEYIFKRVEGEKFVVKKEDIIEVKDTYTDFQKAVLDGQQLAFKVTCNSLYGQVGASTSSICCKELAASTTATGRKMVIYARDYTLEKYQGSKLVYGDSVLGDEPILLKNVKTNMISIKTIETLSNEWETYQNFKPFDNGRNNKQKSKCDDYLVWSNGKWTKIKKVIRHKTKKKIYRINTHCGTVDVTEDHSLLNDKCEILKPKDTEVGITKLLCKYPEFNDTNLKKHSDIMNDMYHINNELSIEEKKAFIYGFFFGDGSCGFYEKISKYSWALNKSNKEILEKCKCYCKEVYGDNTNFKILDTMKSSKVYKLVPKGSIKFMYNEFKRFYDKDRYKIIPDEILNSSVNIRYQFFIGYYAADGSKNNNTNVKNIRFSNKGKIGSAHLYYLAKSLGYSVSINTRKDKPNIFRISCCLGKSKNSMRKPKNILKKCIEIGSIDEEKFVYDLETEEGVFQAGIGDIIVKNTDSVFINFVDYIKKVYGKDYPDGKIDDKEMIRLTIEVGKEAGSYVTSKLKRPQDLEYEKVFWPFMIFSKKRYYGNKYEFSTTKYKPTSMGIVMKRRDNALIVKDIYGGIVDFLMNKRDVKGSYEFFRQKVRDLLNGKIDISRLVISKSLKADYANPTTIPHKILADRMGIRDPGNKPQSNDRLPYCYIDESNLRCKVCNFKIDRTDCKCTDCMELFCKRHIKNHSKICKKMCRFCRVPLKVNDKGKSNIKRCGTCFGNYCEPCFKKHMRRKDKYKKIHYDKCKKPLSTKLIQGDIVEEPSYIKEKKLKIDNMYYLEHQIEKPVLQIFELIRKDPHKLLEDIKRDFNNKKKGQKKTIMSFFGKKKK